MFWYESLCVRYSIRMRYVFLLLSVLVVIPAAFGAAATDVTQDGGVLPTCTVTAQKNIIENGETTTLEWTSANAKTLYISNVGYVAPNVRGTTKVGPVLPTSYIGTVSDGTHTVECRYRLGVRRPLAPTCAISALPNPIYAGETTTISWSSARAQSCVGKNIDTRNASAGDARVSPSSSTSYFITCSGPGGSVECAGNGPNGIGATAYVDPGCEPSSAYSCDGPNIVRTDTNSRCEKSLTTVRSCGAPSFCLNGAAVCQLPQMEASIRVADSFLASGDQSTISWTSKNASACTVRGNGDVWEGRSGSERSSPVTQEVTYTIECSSGLRTVTDSVTITPLPAR